jgi:hypothetical protein
MAIKNDPAEVYEAIRRLDSDSILPKPLSAKLPARSHKIVALWGIDQGSRSMSEALRSALDMLAQYVVFGGDLDPPGRPVEAIRTDPNPPRPSPDGKPQRPTITRAAEPPPPGPAVARVVEPDRRLREMAHTLRQAGYLVLDPATAGEVIRHLHAALPGGARGQAAEALWASHVRLAPRKHRPLLEELRAAVEGRRLRTGVDEDNYLYIEWPEGASEDDPALAGVVAECRRRNLLIADPKSPGRLYVLESPRPPG